MHTAQKTGERTERPPATAGDLPAARQVDWPTELFVLGGADRGELLANLGELQTRLQEQTGESAAELGAALARGLTGTGLRLAVVASNLGDLAQKLASARQQLASAECTALRDPSGIYFDAQPLLATGQLAVLFPGEGAQYLGMLGELAREFQPARDMLVSFDREIGPDGDDTASVSRFFQSPSRLSPEARQYLEQRLRGIDWAMNSVLAADAVMGQMLREIGLGPAALAGHSAGELAALAGAGVLKGASDIGLLVEALRSQGQFERSNSTDEAWLLATAASRESLSTILPEVVPNAFVSERPTVFIAMDNCPHQTVVVGLREPMERVADALKARQIFCERLPFGRPYHTPLFEPYMGPFREAFAKVTFSRPVSRLYSCTTGEPFPDEPSAIRDLALAHWSSPVEFRRLIENLYASGARVFVEAGPRGMLSAFVTDILRDRKCLALPADLPRRSGLTQWNHLVGQLMVEGANVDLCKLYRLRNLDAGGPAAGGSPSAPLPIAAVPPNAAAPPSAALTSPPAPLPSAGSASPAAPQASTAERRMPPRPNALPGGSTSAPRQPAAVVMNRHLDLMQHFLEQQNSALRAYLATRSGGGKRAGRGIAPSVPRVDQAPLSKSPPTGATHLAQAASGVPGPLAGTLVRTEPDGTVVMHRRLDLAEDRYADEHTVGGRDISRIRPEQRGLPVMPMTFILEMMAEAAAQLAPGMVVIAIRDVQLQKWLAFDEDSPTTVELKLRRGEAPAHGEPLEIEVAVRDLGRAADVNRAVQAAVSAGIVVLAPHYPVAPRVRQVAAEGSRPCAITLATLYRNLFHGPSFQGVRRLDCLAGQTLSAEIEVLPRSALFASTREPRFLIDPVTVDVGMHPTAAWHLSQPDQAGRILLPFELKRIEFFAPSPEVRATMQVYSEVAASSPRTFVHVGDIADADGKVWCRLEGVKCWRFYLPLSEVNFNGPKDEYFVCQPWEPSLPWPASAAAPAAAGVRLDTRGDLSQAGMLEAAARITLNEREMRQYRALASSAPRRVAWLFRLVAMKDATRLLRLQTSGERHFIADLDVADDSYGRPAISLRGGKRPADFPAVAVCEGDGQIFALAVASGWAGLACEPISNFENLDPAQLASDEEWELLAALAGDPAERLARLVAGRSALQNALGPLLLPDPTLLRLAGAAGTSGHLELELTRDTSGVAADLVGRRLGVRTSISEGWVLASTAEPSSQGARP